MEDLYLKCNFRTVIYEFRFTAYNYYHRALKLRELYAELEKLVFTYDHGSLKQFIKLEIDELETLQIETYDEAHQLKIKQKYKRKLKT